MIQQMLAIWSLVFVPFLNPAWRYGISQFMYCWNLLSTVLGISIISILNTRFPWWLLWASLVDQVVKNTPAMQDTWIRSLGWEDPLEEGTSGHSNILAWRIPRTEVPGKLQSMGSQRVGHDWVTFTSFTFHVRHVWVHSHRFAMKTTAAYCGGAFLKRHVSQVM